jgi:hypothetical protein
MKQATFFNLRAMASTKAIRAARRARERGMTETTITSSAVGAADPDSSRTPLREFSPERVDRFGGQIEFMLIDEYRKYFWPGGLDACPDCGMKPAIEAVFNQETNRPNYRVVCKDGLTPFQTGSRCKMPPGPWHHFVTDAKRDWNLFVKLSK